MMAQHITTTVTDSSSRLEAKIEAKIDDLRGELRGIVEQIVLLENFADTTSDRVEMLDTQVSALEKELRSTSRELAELRDYTKRLDLRLLGLPEGTEGP